MIKPVPAAQHDGSSAGEGEVGTGWILVVPWIGRRVPYRWVQAESVHGTAFDQRQQGTANRGRTGFGGRDFDEVAGLQRVTIRGSIYQAEGDFLATNAIVVTVSMDGPKELLINCAST